MADKKPDNLVTRIAVASDELVKSIKSAESENRLIYREHIKSLIENDYVNLDFVLGEMHISIQGKRSGFGDFHALIIRCIQEIGSKEEAYAKGQNGKKDVAYG